MLVPVVRHRGRRGYVAHCVPAKNKNTLNRRNKGPSWSRSTKYVCSVQARTFWTWNTKYHHHTLSEAPTRTVQSRSSDPWSGDCSIVVIDNKRTPTQTTSFSGQWRHLNVRISSNVGLYVKDDLGGQEFSQSQPSKCISRYDEEYWPQICLQNTASDRSIPQF